MTALADVIQSYGPSLYWPLNSSTGATDVSGNARNGTAGNGISVGGFSSSPISGETLSTEFVEASVHNIATSGYSTWATGTVTFMGWAWRDASGNDDAIFAGTGANPPTLRLGSGSQDVVFETGTGTPTTWTAAWPGNTQWVHWAVRFAEAEDTIALFINGTLVTSVAETDGWGATEGEFRIGCGTGGFFPFDGKMVDVVILARHLYADQIKRICDVGAIGWATQGYQVRNN